MQFKLFLAITYLMVFVKKSAETTERLSEVLNLQAMVSLQRENFSSSLEYLKRAEELTGTSLKLKATTLNNLACFYRRTGKLRTAYNYLQNAFELELKIGNCPSLADTHLNLCAVLSQLGKTWEILSFSFWFCSSKMKNMVLKDRH